MANLPDFLLGQRGINIVASPLHTPDGSLLDGRNAEFNRDQGIGGIGIRGGLAKLNATALAGAVQGLTPVPFTFPADPFLFIALNSNNGNSWKRSTDGASFTDIAVGTLKRAEDMTRLATLGGVMNPSNFYVNQRPAVLGNKVFWVSDDYTQSVTQPPINRYDGTTQSVAFRVPISPRAGGLPALWVCDLLTAEGLIYISCWDPGTGSALDHRGRVMVYDADRGLLSLVGNRFGDGSDENPAGFPHCLAWYQGLLWAGTNGTGGAANSRIYKIQPVVDTVWTNDHSIGAGSGHVMSMAEYLGNLFVGCSTNDALNCLVLRRTSTGTWSTSLTIAGNPGYFGGMIKFNGNLYTCFAVQGSSVLIKKLNSSLVWSTDKDVGADISNLLAPGNPVIFGTSMYWPFFTPSSDAGALGVLLKCDSVGTWSTVYASVGHRGGAYVLYPAS